MSTVFGTFPVIMMPAIITLAPVPTCNRVEMFPSVAGSGVGEALGVTVAPTVAVGVEEGTGVPVAVAVAVAVAVGVGEGSGVPVAVAVGVDVGVGEAPPVAVKVSTPLLLKLKLPNKVESPEPGTIRSKY